MDLTQIVVTVIGTAGLVWIAYVQFGRKRKKEPVQPPEQEAASVLDPQREHVAYLRHQVDDLQLQLRECYVRRNDAVERVARLEERLRVRRREDS